MSLQISISPNASFSVGSMFSTTEATVPCCDKRCDNVFGEDYGCILMNPDTNCEYMGSSCAGYKPCSSSVIPEETDTIKYTHQHGKIYQFNCATIYFVSLF